MYPKHSYLEAFNEVLPDMKKSIVGSVDELCDKAIAKKVMTHAEKAGIFVDNDIYKQASRFLDSLAPKIEVHPQVLALLMNMLSGLGLRTCNEIVLGIGKWFLLLGGGGGGGRRRRRRRRGGGGGGEEEEEEEGGGGGREEEEGVNKTDKHSNQKHNV